MGLDDNVIATQRKGEGSASWYLYNKDVRESTSSMINSAGELAKAYEYDEFGETTVKAGDSFYNEICYMGQMYDESTGLYYYNARFYNSEDGRFLSQDTYRGEQNDPGTWHLYSYCANDPVNYTDPSGHKKKKANKIKWRGRVYEEHDKKYWFQVGSKKVKIKKSKKKKTRYYLKIGCKASYQISYWNLSGGKQNKCWKYRTAIEIGNEYMSLIYSTLQSAGINVTTALIAAYLKDGVGVFTSALFTAGDIKQLKKWRKKWKAKYKEVKYYYGIIKKYGKKI